MKKSVWLVGLGLVAVVGLGTWKLNSFFGATLDWPMILMNAKADAQQARAENGLYDGMPSQSFHDFLAENGVAGQLSFETAEKNSVVTVVLTGMTERACLGLRRHPMLVENFSPIDVEGGVCKDGSVMRFRAKG